MTAAPEGINLESRSIWRRGNDAATLYEDRILFSDGTVVTECPWNTVLALDAFLLALDYREVVLVA